MQLPGSLFRLMRMLMGVPTMWLRPTTTQCFPSLHSIMAQEFTMPAGVAEQVAGQPRHHATDVLGVEVVLPADRRQGDLLLVDVLRQSSYDKPSSSGPVSSGRSYPVSSVEVG